MFVQACYLLCTRSISRENVDVADKLLLNFCCKFQYLYGGENTTMYMHLHCHLTSSILDYGPVYSYWLFSFERFNGILGGIPTNNRSIDVQLMKHFVCDQLLQSDSVNKSLEECGMQKILSSYKSVKGSVARQTCANDSYQILGPLKRESFDKEDSDDIASLFLQTEFPDCSVKCLRLHQKLKALTDSGRVLGSIIS